MSRREEALRYLASWDPDAVELPDWVVDEIERDDVVRAAFDARFEPWNGRELGLAPVAAPPPRRRSAFVRYGLPLGAVGLLAAGALVALAPLLTVSERVTTTHRVSSGPVADPGPDHTVAAATEGVVTRPADPPPPGATPVPPDQDPAEVLRSMLTAKPQAQAVRSSTTSEVRLPPPALAGRERPAEKVVVQRSSIQIREHVLFDGDTEPVEEAAPILDAVADVMKNHPDLGPVVVEGHSEATGTPDERRQRSFERANAVRNELVARGVPADKLVVDGRGDTMPLVAASDPRAASLNGRVEFRLAEVSPPAPVPAPTTEEYRDWGVRGFETTSRDPLSTFSIDVDTASYALVRRKLREGYLPPTAAVRVEEFVNAMTYTYPPPPEGAPFGVSFEAAPNPFDAGTHLVRVGVQGKRVPVDQRRSVHLTFLVDTSGSMMSDDKLPLAVDALKALTGELRDGDTVAIVAYAGSAGVVLPPTPMSRRADVLGALGRLQAGGSTAMGHGIELAYELADETFHEDAINRVVIVSDGDANVGTTDPAVLTELIRGYARKGITLTVAGFGMGNYKDTRMEALADDGDGNYWYIDGADEAREVFVDRLQGTLVVIAKDVKIQVAWNPDAVQAYRLLGYENRDIADADFRNDRVDAGEIGSGHQVTALYEVALAPGASGTLATVSIRNKAPGPDAPAVERSYAFTTEAFRPDLAETSANFRLAVGAAYFAEKLRGSAHVHDAGYDRIREIARSAARAEYPEDQELVDLIGRASGLRTTAPREGCHEFTVISGGVKRVILVDDNGMPCR